MEGRFFFPVQFRNRFGVAFYVVGKDDRTASKYQNCNGICLDVMTTRIGYQFLIGENSDVAIWG